MAIRRLRGALVFAVVCWASSGFAQDAPVPSGDARIVGRVIHEASGEGVAGVDVILYALPQSGEPPGLSRGRSDESGDFAFEGISNSPRIGYLVGARYRDVPFAGAQLGFEAGESEARVDIRVSDIRGDRGALSLEEVSFRLDWRGRELVVAEEIRLDNPHDETLFVEAPQRPTAVPFLRLETPPGARDLVFPFGVDPEGLVRADNSLSYYGPIYPGEQPFRFGYSLSANDEDPVLELDLPVPEGVKRAVLLVAASGPQPDTLLTDEGMITIAERPYRRYAAEIGSVTFVSARFALPKTVADPSRVTVGEMQWIIDGDAAMLRLREQYKLVVTGEESVTAEAGRALLRLGIPEGAVDIRFDSGDANIELRADPSGGLAVDGPLPPGETTLRIHYSLPVRENPVQISREITHETTLVRVFIADDGRTLATSDALHRRRPQRTADRNYIQLEAFALEAGTPLELRLEALAPRSRLAQPLFFGFLALGTLGVVALMSAPLRRGQESFETQVETPETRERHALLASLRDLEHDFETGKVSEEDHSEMREALRYRAAKTFEGESRKASANPPPPGCPSCEADLPEGAQFCPRCGTPQEVIPADSAS